MKTIDTETAEGLAEFQRLAERSSAQESAYRRSRGLGDVSTPNLFSAVALKLWTIGEPSDAELLFKYSSVPRLIPYGSMAPPRRGNAEHAWQTKPRVRDVLQREAMQGDDHARELVMRTKEKPGLYDVDAAAEYWRLYATDCREAGHNKAADLCELIASLPGGGREILARHAGKPMHKATVRAQRRLSRYDRETTGLSGDELFDKESRLAEAEGMTRKNYLDYIADARKASAKLYALD